MIICGVDGAISTTGICIYNEINNDLIAVRKISTNYGPIKNETDDNRIVYVVNEIISVCKEFNVEMLILEDQFVGFKTSKKTAMQLSRLRGALMYSCNINNIKIKYMNTNTVAKIVKAVSGLSFSKEDDKKLCVYNSIKEIFKGNSIIENLGEYNNKNNKNKNSDMFDALALIVAYKHDCE